MNAIPPLTHEAPAPWNEESTRFLLSHLTDSVGSTLKVYGQTTGSAGPPVIRRPGVLPLPSPDIIATIGISSEPFRGNLMLGFPESTYLAVISRWFGAEITELTDEYQDGAAEFLNVALGQTKTALNAKGFNLQPALPTVVRGKELRLVGPASASSVIVPFSTLLGAFYLELSADLGKKR